MRYTPRALNSCAVMEAPTPAEYWSLSATFHSVTQNGNDQDSKAGNDRHNEETPQDVSRLWAVFIVFHERAPNPTYSDSLHGPR